MSEHPSVPSAVLEEVVKKEQEFAQTIEAKKETKEKMQGTVFDELKQKEQEFEKTVEAKKEAKEKMQGSVFDELKQKEQEFEKTQEAKKETGEKKKSVQDELLNSNVSLKHVETKETREPLVKE